MRYPIAGPAPLLLAVFGAGLAGGLLQHPLPPLGAIVLLALFRASGGASAWLAVSLLLGVVHGVTARWAAAGECPARIASGQVTLTVRLVDPSGGMGRALPIDAGCHGHIQVRWPPREDSDSSRPAGTVARVTGLWRPTERSGRPSGILLARSVVRLGQAATTADRLRTAAEAAINRLYGARAPIVDAVLLGRRDGIDPTIRDAFADAGLVHLLAISGFHVGLIGGWLLLVLRGCRLSRGSATMLAAVGTIAYAAFLGWPPPATRAALLAGVAAWSRLQQRQVQPGSLLATVLLLVLLNDPWAVLSVGAWLSASAVAGVFTAMAWVRRRAPGRWQEALAASIGATLATAPITAFAFGTVSLVGVPLNLIAIPLAALAVPGALVSLVVALAGGPADALAGGTGIVLLALERLARFGSSMPNAVVVTEPGFRAILPWLGVLAVALWTVGVWGRGVATTRRMASHRVILATAALAWGALLAGVGGPAGHADGLLTLHFLDVGQGDAAAIRTPHGHWVLVDAGPAAGRSDAGRRVVVPFLRRAGARSVGMLVVSHAHLDHLGGAGAVLARLPVGVVLEPAVPVDEAPYLGLLAQTDSAGARYLPARPGLSWVTDGVRFSVLHPDTTRAEWGFDLNEDSAILLVQYGKFRALFVGDAGLVAEETLRGRFGRVDVLKVGHHGSRGASGTAFLAETSPRAAIISVGENRYGHPAPEALARLVDAGAEIWRTDQDGTVRVDTDGKTITIHAGKRRSEYRVHDRTP